MSFAKNAGLLLALGAIALGGITGSVASAAENELDRPHIAPDELEGTIWFSEQPHRRVTVSMCGDIEIKEGKEIYVHFIERVDDIFVIEVRWWNEQADLNVNEFGVLAQIEPNEYRYIEADHGDTNHEDEGENRNDFPGIIGRGTFELLSENEAKLIQIGHLVDGSASGFTTTLTRIEELPEVPLDQTYPSACPVQ